MLKFGDRLRIFSLATILAVWLFVIDGLNFCIHFSQSSADSWAIVLVIISGFIFAILAFIGACLTLCFKKSKAGAVWIIVACLFAGALRFIATIIGFGDFFEGSDLDSTTNGTTDIAILLLQVLFHSKHAFYYNCVSVQ